MNRSLMGVFVLAVRSFVSRRDFDSGTVISQDGVLILSPCSFGSLVGGDGKDSMNRLLINVSDTTSESTERFVSRP
jgi:hypothetical protein